MAGLDSLTAESLNDLAVFNWTWTIELVVCIILVLFFSFYFNRLFATIVSYGLRAYTWHKFRVWIDIQGLQISFLAGRVFFKGVRYHGENETILIHNGHLTWRYWLRIARQVGLVRANNAVHHAAGGKEEARKNSEEVTDDDIEEAGITKTLEVAEARVGIAISGLEWFVYNRTPAYDAILRESLSSKSKDGPSLTKDAISTAVESDSDLKYRRNGQIKEGDYRSSASDSPESPQAYKINSSEANSRPSTAELPDSLMEDISNSQSTPVSGAGAEVSSFYSLLVGVLPLEIDCAKGAISLGNETTRAIIVTTFTRARGHIDASGSGSADIYRQLFDFEIEHPVIQMRPNPDYRSSQHTTAERIISSSESIKRKRRWWNINMHFQQRRRKLAHNLRHLIPVLNRSIESFQTTSNEKSNTPYANFESSSEDQGVWHGLDRYLDEGVGNEHEGWAHIDYARFSTILDSPAVHLTFYWDVPGQVTQEHLGSLHFNRSHDINGYKPPAYGLDLVVKGGNVNYGPWADRLRAEMQAAFFPNPYKSSQPTGLLQPGDWRQSTTMIIRVDIEDEVTLRVPTRERSKDWQWRGRAQAVKGAAALRKQQEKRHFRFRRNPKASLGPDIRPFGWVSVTVARDSTVRYSMDMFPRQAGFTNKLHLELKDTRASSSVNHALLWRCPLHEITCDLSNPLVWNSQHRWHFNIRSESMEMFLLRDHMFLLTDLIGDFTAGSKADYMTFVPFSYSIDLSFRQLKLYLNANDHNIIDNPCDLEDNTFLVLGMQHLDGEVEIPLTYFSPRQSHVLFKAKGQNASLDLITPPWNTLHTFLDDNIMFTLKTLNLDGSYNYYTSTSPTLTDSLVLNISGIDPVAHLHGFLIRYFMNVKDNYFGDDPHFKTLEEYQDSLKDNVPDTSDRPWAQPKNDNGLDVILSVLVDKGCVLLPANIYSRERSVRLDILLIEADMRFTNYYMDLQVNSSPIELSLQKSKGMNKTPDISSCQLFMKSLSIYGHRIFGAPPIEPTYICNWDFDIGELTGECTIEFIQTLVRSIKSLIFTLDDYENALPNVHAIPLHDVTFLRARLAGLRTWVLTEDTAFLLEISRSTVNFNDWAGKLFAKRVDADVPSIVVAAVDLRSATRQHESRQNSVTTYACFETSVRIGTLDKTDNLAQTRSFQQKHIRYHDQKTHRADWLLQHIARNTIAQNQPEWSRDSPSMPVPHMPQPTTMTHPIASATSIEQKSLRRMRSKNSFLSSTTDSSWKPSGVHSRREGRQKTAAQELVDRDYPSKVETNLNPNGYYNDVSRNGSSRRPSVSAALVASSSPWTPPHFKLQHVRIDKRNMPDRPQDSINHNVTIRDDDENQKLEPESFPGIGHMGILCSLGDGFLGFLTPSFLLSLANLIEQVQVARPTDMLDDVQSKVVSNLMKSLKEQKLGDVLDVDVHLPLLHLKFVNSGHSRDYEKVYHEDHINFKMTGAHATCRLPPTLLDQAPPSNILSYLSIEEISTTITDNMVKDPGKGCFVELSLSDFGFWSSSHDHARGRLQLNSVEVKTWAHQTVNMAQFLRRTIGMCDSIASRFISVNPGQSAGHLAYHLTQSGSAKADPPFLTRPSYVLRSAEKHVRPTDAWKMMSRLRNAYNDAAKEMKNLPFEDCDCCTQKDVDITRQQVLIALEKWQGWDSNPDDKGPLLDALFGTKVIVEQAAKAAGDLHAEIILGKLSFVLDPGHDQTDLNVIGANTTIITSTKSAGDTSKTQRAHHSKIVVQSYWEQFSLNLNWNLVDLASSISQALEVQEGQVVKSPSTQDKQVKSIENSTEVSCIVGADIAVISLSTINLRLRMGADALKAAINHSSDRGEAQSFTLAVTSNTAFSKLKDHSHTLLHWRLLSPKIYTSIQTGGSLQKGISVLRLAAACQRLRFDLREDISRLMRTIEHVIGDEIHSLYDLGRGFQTTAGDAKPGAIIEQPKEKSSSQIELHIAMFLEDFKLAFALTPSLSYVITGEVARSSISPRSHGHSDVNFDLARHSHEFRQSAHSSFHKKSILEMPAINGRVSIITNDHLTMIQTHATIEEAVFEAAAVRACFDTLTSPRVVEEFRSIKTGSDSIQTSLASTLGKPTETRVQKSADESSIIQFALQGTIAGIVIRCSAPAVGNHDYNADFDFKLGATSLHVHNKSSVPNKVYELPQFSINVKEIGVDLQRRSERGVENFGKFSMGIRISGVTESGEDGNQHQLYRATTSGIKIDLFEETATLVVDVVAFLQERIKSIHLPDEARNIKPLRRLTMAGLSELPKNTSLDSPTTEDGSSMVIFGSVFSLTVERLQVRWRLNKDILPSPGRELEDLVFSIRMIDLQTRKEGSARLSFSDLQLQIVAQSQDPILRTANSALLPEVVFSAAYYSTRTDRHFAFQAKGKALDLRLAADFVLPAMVLQQSLANAVTELRKAQTDVAVPDSSQQKPQTSLLGGKHLASLLIDADFAGAVVNISSRQEEQSPSSVFNILKGNKRSRAGRYGKAVQGDNAPEATLRAPGIALKVEYRDNRNDDPILSTEIRVAASSNTLYPSVVPVILEISSSIKESIGDSDPISSPPEVQPQSTRYLSDAAIENSDPTALLGKIKLNAGLWIQRQEFSLSCQPIARVAATAKFDDIFLTVNTVQSADHDRFFSILTTFKNLEASVQHVYSRESTASFEVDSIVMSLMNSKHVSSTTGISAILHVSPMKTDINAKQLQDFLLFREIWYPEELRSAPAPIDPIPATSESQAHVIQRYQQLTAGGNLAWNAILSFDEVKLSIDLGQGLGKSLFTISELWASSKKKSASEQDLCIGFRRVGIDSTGRMSGFVELQGFRARTSIRWLKDNASKSRAPLVQGSIGFDHLRAKVAFDYQPFAVADISSFDFLMYNVRQGANNQHDRLVGILNGGKVQVFCTTATAAQTIAIIQAFEKLIQEKQEAYESSLHELDRYLRRRSAFPSGAWTEPLPESQSKPKSTKSTFLLHTDVVLTLGEINVGAFPNTFFDGQILKIEAKDAQARFAVATTAGKTHSGLGMSLGQVRVALSTVKSNYTQALGEVSVAEVVTRATGSRGGTILKVPRLVSSMQTWQADQSNIIEYIFRSTFEGKVDVGWNYSRISFIRGMWQVHSRALAQRLGKPLPPSAVKITAEADENTPGQEKITAVVNVPQSKYQYVAIEPPVIDTPQLRDMGEATPPLEWIGLHRDRLPEATHSVAIVTLLEIAREVEDAYTRILGSA